MTAVVANMLQATVDIFCFPGQKHTFLFTERAHNFTLIKEIHGAFSPVSRKCADQIRYAN